MKMVFPVAGVISNKIANVFDNKGSANSNQQGFHQMTRRGRRDWLCQTLKKNPLIKDKCKGHNSIFREKEKLIKWEGSVPKRDSHK